MRSKLLDSKLFEKRFFLFKFFWIKVAVMKYLHFFILNYTDFLYIERKNSKILQGRIVFRESDPGQLHPDPHPRLNHW